MKKSFAFPFLLPLLALALPGCTATRDFAATGYHLPAAPATLVVMRPDVEVGSLSLGGVATPNADWTRLARTFLADAIVAREAARGDKAVALAEQQGDAAETVADYEALHRAVALSIARYKYGEIALPTKKGRFDWTLGPGVARVGTLAGGGSHALFLYGRDFFATDSRKAMQVAGTLGCIIGLCLIPTGGEHFAYASLVDLRSGDVVWFNILQGSAGDIRTPEGARAMVEHLLATMPGRGEAPK